MKLVADLHIHSHYSRATSKRLDFEHLYLWAQIKGVDIVGSGDLSHPGWLQEMRDKLEPAEDGLFKLKDELAAQMDAEVPPACRAPVRFLLTGEISNIYKRHGKVRKVHNVVFAPSLDAVARFQARLEQIGNIRSDGRPILGLDSRDLLEIVLETDDRCHLIPAHIWTPWFSMLGSKSGFDRVEECFGDLTDHIFALETGLSSDPPMNWRVSNLDRYTLVSNSDAHSPPKLAREATLFDTERAYDALFQAMKSGDPSTFKGTIEFFPEEGKYHHDGHRKCGVSWTPKITLAHDGLCPVCGKPVTVGVLHRVEELADRPEGGKPARTHPFHSLIPLPEIISELVGVGVNSKRVQREFFRLLGALGSELRILQELPLDEIAAVGGERLAQGIGRMRRGQVNAQAGFDGEYGVIRIFDNRETGGETLQIGLFGEDGEGRTTEDEGTTGRGESGEVGGVGEIPPPVVGRWSSVVGRPSPVVGPSSSVVGPSPSVEQALLFDEQEAVALELLAGLNEEQRAAALHETGPLIIVAGPGTGKTRTLTHRMAYLVRARNVSPANMLAITFTNKAAQEMRERLTALLGESLAGQIAIKTFHAFGAMLLREFGPRIGLDDDFAILDEEERRRLLRRRFPELGVREINRALEAISAAKTEQEIGKIEEIGEIEEIGGMTVAALVEAYEAALRENNGVDFDDLIVLPLRLLEEHEDVLETVCGRYSWISVDEYQDVNHLQVRLLKLLAGDGQRLCVIGDPDQAIYGFRGADRRYFLAFAQDYPGATVRHLSRNYRSTQTILEAAQQVIAHSPDREALAILSDFVVRTRLDVRHAPTDKAEAEYVVHQIERMVGGTSYFSLDSGRVDDRVNGRDETISRSFADFAVLYRTGAQSHALAEALDRSGIPYQIVGQTPLTAHRVVRLALAHLWLLRSPYSAIHLDVILNHQRVVFEPDRLAALIAATRERGIPPWRTPAPVALTPGERETLLALAGVMREIEAIGEIGVAGLVEAIARLLDERTALSDADRARLKRLQRRAVLFGDDLDAFLEAAALQAETDDYDPRADRVALMTLHAAKGLEFPVVFMVGCEEGLLPYVRPGTTDSTTDSTMDSTMDSTADGTADEVNVDEERRLFYVGMTRAKEKLILTSARRRFLFGQAMENQPSRFVDDIEQALKAVQEGERRKAKEEPDHVQLRLF